MEFENLNFDEGKVNVADSGKDSDLTLVILPGIEGARAWKHQYQYFKTDFRTLVLDPENRERESYTDAAGNILDRKNLSNCILIGANLGCYIVDRVKDSGRVVSSIYTDIRQDMPAVRREVFKTITRISAHPKLMSKMVFCEKTRYRTVKEFSDDMDLMEWREIKSFRGSKLEGGAANGFLIYPEGSRFTKPDARAVMEPDLSVSRISSGSFCFYEKPEEYNKALYDFINKLENFQKQAEVREKRESNRTLAEFEQNKRTRKVREK